MLFPFAILAYLAILIIAYSFINPALSTFMADAALSGQRISHKWVPLRRISKHVPVAVIMSEDNKFCKHYGVDLGELKAALLSNRDKPRGASTITMQTVKNLYLWSGRDYVRKAIEIPLAFTVSAVWSKRRTMEMYLNFAQFGPGIYGVEAAARYHFKKRASQLTRHEASLLAAVLPNPTGRNAGRPGPKTRSVSRVILRRMKAGRFYSSCVR